MSNKNRGNQQQQQAKQSGVLTELKFIDVEVPLFYENPAKGEYVQYGKENDYPRYLFDLYNSSPLHAAIVNGKVDYICANGWTYNRDGLNAAQIASIDKFITGINPKTRIAAFDGVLFNWIAFEAIWNKAGTSLTFEHVPISDVRIMIDPETKDITGYAYTSQWYTISTNGVRKKNPAPQDAPDFVEFGLFDEENKTGRQLLVYVAPLVGSYVYPLPEYYAAIKAIETDSRLQQYDLNEVANGFSASVVINIPGSEWSDKKKRDDMEDTVMKKASGETGKRFLLNFVTDPNMKATVETIDLPSVDRFSNTQKNSERSIFTAHTVTSPMLFGIKTEGQLGGRDEMDVAEDIFIKRYVSGWQMVLEGMINKLAKYAGVPVTLTLSDVKPKQAKTIEAFSQLPPMLASKVAEAMSAEEIRELVGLKGTATTTTQTTQARFSIDVSRLTGTKKHIEAFSKRGRSRSDFSVISKRAVDTAEYSDIEAAEMRFVSAYFDEEIVLHDFAESGSTITLKSVDRVVLDMLSKSPALTAAEIAKASKLPVAKIEASITQLTKSGYLKSVADGLTPTATGNKVIERAPAKTAEIEVLYSYEVAPGMGAPILPKDENGNERTREFCYDLIKLDRMYTKEEILAMENDFGGSAWEVRGGWYTKPGTTIATPQCRHIWMQNIVTRN
jgi:DNA-binding MarR family transcriptional regulator